jgi:hypothetical protein
LRRDGMELWNLRPLFGRTFLVPIGNPGHRHVM